MVFSTAGSRLGWEEGGAGKKMTENGAGHYGKKSDHCGVTGKGEDH
jgi:hypothetical protein